MCKENISNLIKYIIPFVETHRNASLHTTLKVYDILGYEIATLINAEQQSGEYQIEFDGSNLSNRIYFYRLSQRDKSIIKKMLLVK